jgi:outer membrane protein assembly factor BamB
MRFPANGNVVPVLLSANICLCLVLATTGRAQQIQFNFGPPPEAELTPPRVDLVSSATATRLAQAQALLADKNWDEAIDVFRELAAEDTGRVVALDDQLFVNLRDYCNLQIARMPAAGLTAYRRRVDPLAVQWYRTGVANRDPQQLGRLVDEAFCSSWGDDALLALGELALERADYGAARRYWEQISPLLRSPDGRTPWLALRDIDPRANWQEIQRRWQARDGAPGWLAYPDTTLNLAEVRAWLILASVRANEFDRAQLEFEIFRRLHPEATGRLGGQDGPLGPALERVLTSAHQWPMYQRPTDWPTLGGSPTRSPNVEPTARDIVAAWPKPIPLAAALVSRPNRTVTVGVFGRRAVDLQPQATAGEADRPLSCFPIVADGVVLFADGASIQAVRIDNGRPAITSDSVLHRYDKLDENKSPVVPFDRGSHIAHGQPRYSLTVSGGIVYGRVGPIATSRLAGGRASVSDRLIGFDLRREGLLAFSAPAKDESWSFDGVPVGDGRRVLVAMRHSDVSPHAYVACFDATSGALLWRTSIGAADTPAAGDGDEITHNLLTLVEDRVYFNSNLGLVAALDTTTGRICWLRRYDRLSGKRFTPGGAKPVHFGRDPAPTLYEDGLLIIAPSDTPQVFAIDADTGRTVWENDQMADGLQLLGVADQTLAVGGNRLRAVDLRTGAVRWVWPESEHAGIRGMGRGVVAGNEVFWPTRREIYAVDVTTGTRTRSPISLELLGNSGANLAVGQGRLIAAGPDKLMVFGPLPGSPPAGRDQQAQLSNN